MENVVTFVLGAGFSKICGFPLASEVNSLFKKYLETKTVVRASSSEWVFENREPNEYAFDNKVLSQIIQLYEKDNSKDFNYEDALDWIVENENHLPERVKEWDNSQLRGSGIDLDFVFIHLIKSVIDRRINEEMIVKFNFLIEIIDDYLTQGYKINFFTLNHDRLLERILDYHGYRYSDGFSTWNTPLYFESKKIPVYDFNYMEDINIHKLHGSLNYYNIRLSVQSARSSYTAVSDYYYKAKINNYFEKHSASYRNKKMNPHNSNFNLDIKPNFVVGSKKMELINNDYTYRDLLRRFHISCIMSETIVIFGYSYQDDHINEIIDLYGYNYKMNIVNVNPKKEYPLNMENKQLKIVNLKDHQNLKWELRDLDQEEKNTEKKSKLIEITPDDTDIEIEPNVEE